ncbi:hypothetical protein ACIQU8_36040 [Streptomyces griseus]|uniref:hypothetical protein n=1 Tax=Streptomyces griseus TaxID=1911 RepID=UPI003816D16E
MSLKALRWSVGSLLGWPGTQGVKQGELPDGHQGSSAPPAGAAGGGNRAGTHLARIAPDTATWRTGPPSGTTARLLLATHQVYAADGQVTATATGRPRAAYRVPVHDLNAFMNKRSDVYWHAFLSDLAPYLVRGQAPEDGQA